MQQPRLEVSSVKEGLYFRLYKGDKVPKPISGHRFVGLLGNSPFHNGLTLLLDFFDFLPYQKNDFATIGNIMEDKILDLVWGKGVYEKFSYRDYHGDMFPNVSGFNGLIDGKHKFLPKIAEVKCYFFKRLEQDYYSIKQQKSIKKCPLKYWLQARFYLWLMHKNNPYCNIKKIEIITLRMLTADVEEITSKDFEIPANLIQIFEIKNYDDGFEEKIDLAIKLRKKLVKEHLDKNGEKYCEVLVPYTDVTANTLKHLKMLFEGDTSMEGNKLEVLRNDLIWKDII